MQTNRWLKIFRLSMVKDGFGQSGDETLNFPVSEEWTDGINSFLNVSTYSQKLKADQIFFVWTRSKMSVASLVMELFLEAGTNSGKQKLIQ